MSNYKVYLKALHSDKSGHWDRAHEIVQNLSTPEAAWIHAYLHRKEGDEWNARYWYGRAGKDFFQGSLEEEWQYIHDQLSQ